MQKIKLKSEGRRGTISRAVIRAVVRNVILPHPTQKAHREVQK
jgi:hypothetical protein